MSCEVISADPSRLQRISNWVKENKRTLISVAILIVGIALATFGGIVIGGVFHAFFSGSMPTAITMFLKLVHITPSGFAMGPAAKELVAAIVSLAVGSGLIGFAVGRMASSPTSSNGTKDLPLRS